MLRRTASILLAALLLAFAGSAAAATCRSTGGGGSWSAASTWTTCNGGIPTATDDVEIRNADSVNIPAAFSAVARTVTFTSSNGQALLSHDASTSTLTIGSGGMVINSSPSLDAEKGWLLNAGTGIVNGSITIVAGNQDDRPAGILITTGTLEVRGVNGNDGDITMTNGSSAVRTEIRFTGAGNLRITRSFVLNGGRGTLTPSTGRVTYQSASTASVAGGSAISYNNLTIDKPLGTANLAAIVPVAGDLTVTAGTFDLQTFTANRSSSGGTITVDNGAVLKIGGSNTFPSGYTAVKLGTTSTINYSGTAQTISALSGQSYGHLLLTGSGNKNIGSAGGQTLNIAGDLTVGIVVYRGNAVTPNPAVNLMGNFVNNGAFTSGTGLFRFNGSSPQTITGSQSNTTISSLSINNPAGVTLIGVHNVTSASVDIAAGRIKTGSNVLILSNNTSITSNGASILPGASTFVVGQLQKRVPTGSNVSVTYEVGTEPGGVPRYAPVGVNFGSVTTAGNLRVTATNADHPNIGTSTLDATRSVNRYWTLATFSPLSFTASSSNSISFRYGNPADFNGESVTAGSLFAGRYSPALPAAGTWTELAPINTLGTTSTISGTGITTATINGDYQLANKPSAVPNPGSFDVFETTQADAATPKVIRTKVASGATGFTLSVMAIQAGARLTTFTGTGADVKIELLGNVATGNAIDANNCPVSSTVLQTVSPFNITTGRSNVTFAAVPNSWRDVRVRVTYPVSSPTVTSCSTDNFAIRPAGFMAALTDSNWSAAGTTRALDNTGASGGRVHKAGQPFTITLTPSPATVTNYTDRTVAVGALTCVLAGTCTTSMLNVGTFTGNGTQVSNTATFSEVGAFNLSLQDEDYASVDKNDTPGDCTASGRYVCDSGAPRGVGRFVPDHFALTQVTVPIFRTFDATDASCGAPPSGPRRSFTYIGQHFGYQTPPSAMIVAQNAQNQTTANYQGTLWKLTNASAAQQFDNSPAKTLDITQIGSPVVAETPASGTGTLTPAAAGKLAFQRDNSTPQAEFTANLSLTLSVSDASETGTGEATVTPIGTSTPLVFASIAFDGDGGAGGKTFRYGRLQIGSARGELMVPLAVPMETQYWTGATFATNTADHCTTLGVANVGLGNYAGNLAAGETTPSLSGPFAAGRKNLTLSAPGAGNNGSLDVVVNLGAGAVDSCMALKPVPTTAGANQPWLRSNGSCSAAYTKDPSGRATFGVRLGSEEVIHLRENF